MSRGLKVNFSLIEAAARISDSPPHTWQNARVNVRLRLVNVLSRFSTVNSIVLMVVFILIYQPDRF